MTNKEYLTLFLKMSTDRYDMKSDIVIIADEAKEIVFISESLAINNLSKDIIYSIFNLIEDNHENIFLMTKEKAHFEDQEFIMAPQACDTHARMYTMKLSPIFHPQEDFVIGMIITGFEKTDSVKEIIDLQLGLLAEKERKYVNLKALMLSDFNIRQTLEISPQHLCSIRNRTVKKLGGEHKIDELIMLVRTYNGQVKDI